MIEQTQTITLTITEFIAALRDLGFVAGLFVLGWKGRGWLQPVYEFFKRANTHMDRVEEGLSNMENGMSVLLDNHMTHVQQSLETLAKERHGKVTGRMEEWRARPGEETSG